MRPDDAFGEIAAHYSDQLVVTGVGTTTQEWHRCFGPDRDDAFHVHTMGLVSSFALGLALACPQAPVWAFEGDGGLIMNFGSLLTLADQAPPNLRLFVLDNGRYRTINGGELPNSGRTNLAGVATELGMESCHVIDDVDALSKTLPAILDSDAGFSFTVLRVDLSSAGKPLAPYEGPEIKYRFARYLERRLGIEVFGHLGY